MTDAKPCIVYRWWRRREQSYRLIAWQIANSCAAIIGPLLSYGVGHGAKSGKIHAYQAIFMCLVSPSLLH